MKHRDIIVGSILLVALIVIILVSCNAQKSDPAILSSPITSGEPEREPTLPSSNNSDQPIEQYQTGEVVTVSPGNLLVSTPDRGELVLYLSPKTDVWEGAWVKDIPIEVGDRITAWGQRRADGSLDVEKLWISDVNLIGTISDIQQKGEDIELTFQDRHLGPVLVKIIDQRTEVGLPDGKVPFGKDLVDLKKAHFVQVIGCQFKDGSVLATDLYPEFPQ